MFAPVADAEPPPNVLLRQAIRDAGHSIRGLGRVLAARPDVHQNAESVRRQLGKFLSGKDKITDYWADVLESELNLEDGTLREPPYSEAIEAASQLVRRLEAGETLPDETLLTVAESVEAAGQAAYRLAGRLRRDVAGHARHSSSV